MTWNSQNQKAGLETRLAYIFDDIHAALFARSGTSNASSGK